jgi:iron complex transport system substrate-binding protein
VSRRAAALAAAALSLATALSLAACGDSGGRRISSTAALEIAAPNGKVTIARRPRRIVSLSATGTEDLFAVGAGSQVVAVDSYSTYPKQAPRTKLSGYTPNVEAIARYHPDLVVVAEDTGGVIGRLAKLGVTALLEPPAKTLEDAYGQIEQLARATGHASAATGVIASIKSQIAAAVASVPRPDRPLRVYHELEPTLYSADSRTFIGQLYTMLGLQNVADGAPGATDYPQLSAEYVIKSNPQLIVLADTVCCKATPASVGKRAGWGGIAAVRDGDILPVDDTIASEWGPRIVLFMRALARATSKAEQAR